MTLYDRVCSVEIETKSGAAVKVVEGLRIVFDIKKTRDISTNACSIQIFNLSRETRGRIKDNDALMRVSAGYKQDTGASLIIVGEVQHVVHQRSGPEWVTNLDINDGAVEMRENRISKSFAPGTDAATAVQQLAAAVCPGVDLYASPRGKLEKGFAFSGPAKMALDQICRRFDLEWSVQNNRVQIIPLGGSAAPKVYSLSAASGLIGNPERINYSLGKLKEAKKTEPTWKIRTLLMPALTPAGIVKVDSIDLKGQFTIDNVRHQGDTFGRPWDTEIEIQ